MNVSDSKTFYDRLIVVSGGRDIHPFMAAAGITHGTVTRMKKGQAPSGETLSALMRTANASPSWLMEGKGAPFIVARMIDDDEGSEFLRALLDEDWTVYIVTERGNGGCALILIQPASFMFKGREIDYTAMEIITGNIGNKTMEALMGRRLQIYSMTLDCQQFESLVTGLMPCGVILGYHDGHKKSTGLVENTRQITDAEIPRLHTRKAGEVSEQSAGYARNARVERLIRLYEGMGQADQERLLVIAEALAEIGKVNDDGA